MLGRRDDHVMPMTANRKPGKVQRLCIDLSVHPNREQFSKTRDVHVPGSENALA